MAAKASLPFVHVPLPGEHLCVEVPTPYVRNRTCIKAISRTDPRLLLAPAWRSLLAAEVEAGLASLRAGRPTDLARIIAGLPHVLIGWESVRDALVQDIDTRSFALIRAVMESRPGKARSQQALRFHAEVESLRASDALIDRGGIVHYGAGSTRTRAASSEDQRIVEVAERETAGGETGFERQGGAYARVKKAVQRVRSGGVTTLIVHYVPCEEHGDVAVPAPIAKPRANWFASDGDKLPSIARITRTKTILVRRIRSMTFVAVASLESAPDSRR